MLNIFQGTAEGKKKIREKTNLLEEDQGRTVSYATRRVDGQVQPLQRDPERPHNREASQPFGSTAIFGGRRMLLHLQSFNSDSSTYQTAPDGSPGRPQTLQSGACS